MTSSSQQPSARRGFLASLSAALAPPPIPEDDTGPLRAPKGVITAVVLAMLGGAMYVFSGAVSLVGTNDLLHQARVQYEDQVSTCQSSMGGIGTAITAASPTGQAATCQSLRVLSDTDWSNFHSFSIGIASAYLILGLILIVAGWFLRQGAAWARRAGAGVVVVTVLASMFLGMSTTFILIATLFGVIAVVLCYIGSGAVYFLRVKARKHA